MAMIAVSSFTQIRVFIKQYVALVCFVLLAAIGLVTALGYTSASFDYYTVRNSVAKWQEEENSQSIEDYQQAKAAISSALASQPSHPLYQDLLGQVFEWGAIAGYEENAFALQEAKKHYLKATQLRPLWPVTWASLGMVKWREQAFDDEMLMYLRRADKLGPQKPEVHLLYVRLGMALYASNHPMLSAIRQTFYDRIALGLSAPQSRQQVLALISEYKAHKRVCRWLRNKPLSIRRMLENCPAK